MFTETERKALVELGRLYLAYGRVDRAGVLFTGLLAVYPTDRDCQSAMAVADYLSGAPESALARLDGLLASSEEEHPGGVSEKQHGIWLFLRTMALRKMDRHDAADQAFGEMTAWLAESERLKASEE